MTDEIFRQKMIDMNEHCRKALGLEGRYDVVYIANTCFPYLLDAEDATERLDFDGYPLFRAEEIKEAIDEAMVEVKLPQNIRLIGMQNINNTDEERVFGVVDVSGLAF